MNTTARHNIGVGTAPSPQVGDEDGMGTGRPHPSGWATARLGDVLTDTRNGIYKPDTYYGRGVPILKMFNIGRLNGRWNLASVDMLDVTPSELGFYGLEVGDILLNRVNSRELVGKCAVVNDETRGAVYESKNMRLRVNRAVIDPDWLAAWLNSEGGRQQIDNKLRQIVGQATVNRTDIIGLNVPLPPVAEQQRIMARLREQLAEVERARAAVAAQTQAAEALPAAFLRAVFSTPAAKQWPRLKLEEVAVLQRGRFSPRPRNNPRFYGGAHPFIQTGAAETEDGFIRDWTQTLNDDGLAVSKKFPAGTLVISIAANIGGLGILTFDSCMPDSLVGITGREGKADNRFLYHVLRLARPALKALAPQMAQANLSLSLLAPFEIGVPPLAEQRRIATQLDAEFREAKSLREQLAQKLVAVEKLPAALLREAFAARC